MCTPDRQQAHSRRYEGPDLAQHKTQALFARTNCSLWVQLHKCPCISANIRSLFAAGTTTFPPPHQPSLLLLSLSGLLEVWIPCWEVAMFAAGALGSIPYPALEPGHFYWRGERTSHKVLLFLCRCDASLTNGKDKSSFLQPHFLQQVVTAIAFHNPMKPHPFRLLGKISHEWVCSNSKL